MKQSEWNQIVDRLSVWERRGLPPKPYKALLLLMLLGRALRGDSGRLIFREVEEELRALMKRFGPRNLSPRSHPNPLYPFWYLQRDGCWVIPNKASFNVREGKSPDRTSLSGSEPTITSLRDRGEGYVPEHLWTQLTDDHRVIEDVSRELLLRFWREEQHVEIREAVGLGRIDGLGLPNGQRLETVGQNLAFSFVLEKHLQDFLVLNWSELPISSEWDIYGTEESPLEGVEFRCGVGRIDILAQHKYDAGRWMVLELKRGRTSDHTVGQLARYMGWMRNSFVPEGDQVEGLIIASAADEGLRAALSVLPNARLMLYELDFQLRLAGPERPERSVTLKT